MPRPNPVVSKNRGHDHSAKNTAPFDSLEYPNRPVTTIQIAEKAIRPKTISTAIGTSTNPVDLRVLVGIFIKQNALRKRNYSCSPGSRPPDVHMVQDAQDLAAKLCGGPDNAL